MARIFPKHLHRTDYRPAMRYKRGLMDRRLALKNIRTGLIAGAICLFVFAAAFFAAAVY
jgi:hypothetical protein